MPTTTPYCVLQDVKQAIDLQSTADDAWISGLIPIAQAEIDEYLGYDFQVDGSISAPATRVYDGSGLSRLIINRCISISQVQEVAFIIGTDTNGNIVRLPSVTQDITGDCLLGPANRPTKFYIDRIMGEFAPGMQNYIVSGVFGYPAVPPDITRACTRLVAHYVKMRDANYSDLLNEQGGVRVRYTKNMPPDVLEILDRRKPRVFV